MSLWEGSVRATHIFLSYDEIMRIREYVPEALKKIAHLIIAEDEKGQPAAFMSIWGFRFIRGQRRTSREGPIRSYI